MFSIGSKIRCVKEAHYLTIGNIYTIVDPEQHTKQYGYPAEPCVIDDNGIVNAWTEDKFECVEESIENKDIDWFSINKQSSVP